MKGFLTFAAKMTGVWVLVMFISLATFCTIAGFVKLVTHWGLL
jgi:hypothetical protein